MTLGSAALATSAAQAAWSLSRVSNAATSGPVSRISDMARARTRRCAPDVRGRRGRI